MDPLTKLIPLVIEGAWLLGATACQPQSLPQILHIATVTETIPATQTIIPANHCLDIERWLAGNLAHPGAVVAHGAQITGCDISLVFCGFGRSFYSIYNPFLLYEVNHI